MIFIIKSANSLDFLRQNLEILDGQEGSTTHTEYRQRWIEPAILQSLPKAGEQACIVFSDPPWDLYVPIRSVTLINDVNLTGDKYTFSYALGPRVKTNDLKTFTDQLRLVSKSQYFIVPDIGTSIEQYTLAEKIAWRQTIHSIVGYKADKSSSNQPRLERYLSSLFVRVEEMYADQDLRVDLFHTPLQIGHQYSIVLDTYAPQLPEEKISQMEIVGSADPPILAVRSITASRDARLSLKVTPVYPGTTRLKIWIQPEQTRSSQTILNYTVEKSETQVLPEYVETFTDQVVDDRVKKSCLNQAEVQAFYQRLLSVYTRDHEPNYEYQREIARELESLPLDEDSIRYLEEEQGICAWKQGKFEDAYRILDSIGAEKIRSQEAVASYFICAWNTKKSPDIHHLLDRFEKSSDPELTRQVRDVLPWKTLTKQRELVGDLFLREFLTLEKLKEIIMSETIASEAADWITYGVNELQIMGKEGGYGILREWLEAKSDQPVVTIDTVAQLALRWGIEIGENAGDLLDWFGSRILPERDLEHAKSLIDASINLATPQRIWFWEAMANITRHYPATSWQQFTGELLLEIGRYYLRLPDRAGLYLPIAGEYLQNAKDAYGDMKKTDLQNLLTEWEELARDTPVIRKYLDQFDELKGNACGSY